MRGRKTQLLALDAYGLLAHCVGDVEGAIIDGGANVGKMSELLARRFPKATVHAFEPVTEPYESLNRLALSMPGRIIPHRLALGEANTETTINVNKNLWTSSLLASGDRGLEYYDDWYETQRQERVSVVRLDDWADEHGVEDIQVIKLDLQGFEGPALRGAERTLAGAKAVYAEAQLLPEYEGASLFAELDTLMRDHGYGLYQLVDLYLRGRHLEPACVDGLWLREDVLEQIRGGPAPAALLQEDDTPADRMTDALAMCAKSGLRRVALYGSGYHTMHAAPALARPPVDVVGVIDDDASRHGELWGLPVFALQDAMSMGLDAVVISSDSFEPVLLERTKLLQERGVAVVTLYEDDGPLIRKSKQHAAA